MFDDDCEYCMKSMDVYIKGQLTSRVIDRYENTFLNTYISIQLPIPRLREGERIIRMMNGDVWIVEEDTYPE